MIYEINKPNFSGSRNSSFITYSNLLHPILQAHFKGITFLEYAETSTTS